MAKRRKESESQLNARLEAMLGQFATRKLIEESNFSLEELEPNAPAPKIADLIVHEVVKLALKGKEWAIQLVYDRVEGKAPQGQPVKEDGRILEDRLDAVAKSHLNSFSEAVIQHQESEPENEPYRPPPAPSVDLPEDGAGDSEGTESQPVVAQEIAAGSHD